VGMETIEGRADRDGDGAGIMAVGTTTTNTVGLETYEDGLETTTTTIDTRPLKLNKNKRQKVSVEGVAPKSLGAEMEDLMAFKNTKPSRKDFFERVKQLACSLPVTNVVAAHKGWVMKLRSTVKACESCVENCFCGEWDEFFKVEKLFSHGGKEKWTCPTCNVGKKKGGKKT
jgi:hypothetical protein